MPLERLAARTRVVDISRLRVPGDLHRSLWHRQVEGIGRTGVLSARCAIAVNDSRGFRIARVAHTAAKAPAFDLGQLFSPDCSHIV